MSTPVHGRDASEDQRYVDWYMWARSQDMNAQACHGAARAAVKAEKSMADPAQAAVAGGVKANRDDQQPSTMRKELCNWYSWAIEDRKLPPERALEVARAAAISVQRGESRSKAMDTALAYERGEKVRLGPPPLLRLIRDPGAGYLVVALVVLALALFTDIGFATVLLALGALLIPGRSLQLGGRFTWLMGVAFVLNLAALTVVAIGLRL